jgi:hypothetical protein
MMAMADNRHWRNIDVIENLSGMGNIELSAFQLGPISHRRAAVEPGPFAAFSCASEPQSLAYMADTRWVDGTGDVGLWIYSGRPGPHCRSTNVMP